MNKRKISIYHKYIKRILDFSLSLTAIVILSPVMLLIAILVRIKLGSPVLFQQERPGKDEKIFKLYKFRTMTDEKDESGQLLSVDLRLTKFGRLLRSTSLDELPELWNIVKGDMSIVGPRPLLVQYLPLYNEEQRKRHNVRPGFTGLAQVHGRNSISWEEKFDWDIQYVNGVLFWTDVKIILDTIRIVLKREGISSDTFVTMEKFQGESMEKNIILLGASGHAKVIIDMLHCISNKEKKECKIFLLDDDESLHGTEIMGHKIIGKIDECIKYLDHKFIISIGNNRVRETISQRYCLNYETVIHPSAIIGKNVDIGAGTVVMPGAIVNNGTRIGKHCIINTGATVDHDNTIEDFVHISPGAHLAGTVSVGKGTWMGIGSCCVNNISIGAEIIVGGRHHNSKYRRERNICRNAGEKVDVVKSGFLRKVLYE